MWISRSLGDSVFRRAVLGIVRFGGALIGPIVRWERRWATIRALSALDDRMLSDIGISRNEIEQLALGRLPRRREVIAAPLPGRRSPAVVPAADPAPELRKAA